MKRTPLACAATCAAAVLLSGPFLSAQIVVNGSGSLLQNNRSSSPAVDNSSLLSDRGAAERAKVFARRGSVTLGGKSLPGWLTRAGAYSPSRALPWFEESAAALYNSSRFENLVARFQPELTTAHNETAPRSPTGSEEPARPAFSSAPQGSATVSAPGIPSATSSIPPWDVSASRASQISLPVNQTVSTATSWSDGESHTTQRPSYPAEFGAPSYGGAMPGHRDSPGLIGQSFSPASPSVSATVYFSNLNQSTDFYASLSTTSGRLADDFKTGGAATLINGARLRLESPVSTHTFTLSIFTNTGGNPGTLVGSFAPVSLAQTSEPMDVDFTSPSIALLANTTYWVVLQLSESGDAGWDFTYSTAADMGSVFSTVPSTRARFSQDNGASWQAAPFDGDFMFALFDVTPVPEPSTVLSGLAAAGATLFHCLRRRRKQV